MKERTYYMAHSYMGTEYEWAAECWTVYGYDTKIERDARVFSNPRQNVSITRNIAYKIMEMNPRLYEVIREEDGRLLKYPKYLRG